jgi:hypothetical protein
MTERADNAGPLVTSSQRRIVLMLHGRPARMTWLDIND